MCSAVRSIWAVYPCRMAEMHCQRWVAATLGVSSGWWDARVRTKDRVSFPALPKSSMMSGRRECSRYRVFPVGMCSGCMAVVSGTVALLLPLDRLYAGDAHIDVDVFTAEGGNEVDTVFFVVG